ncbi:hypothetical protein [Georgenia sp. AZ-5]|uniref:hypothetical protein n=1 Tax=Georgenia sp. AZ-5 TaxID=3367526 RepID=UPI0037542F79
MAELLPLQQQDFIDLLEVMDRLCRQIRLIDPPLHEFLPDLMDLSVSVALSDLLRRDLHPSGLERHGIRLGAVHRVTSIWS